MHISLNKSVAVSFSVMDCQLSEQVLTCMSHLVAHTLVRLLGTTETTRH